MKTTKSKIKKSITTLATVPLYGALFISAGCKWLGIKKEITTISSNKRATELIANEANEDIEDIDGGIINQGSDDLLEQPKAEKVSSEPTQQRNSPQADLKDSHNTNQEPVLGEHMDNGQPESSNTLGPSNQVVNNKSQNITPDAPERNTDNDNIATNSGLQVNNNLSKNPKNQGKDSMQAKPDQLSNPVSNPEHTTKVKTSLDEDLLLKIKHLENLKDAYNNQCKDNKDKDLVKAIATFCKHNNSETTLDKVQGLSPKKQKKYIEGTSKQADEYIKQLTGYINEEQSGQ